MDGTISHGANAPSLPATTLVLGGARSGKSAHGERLILDSLTSGARALYLATAQAHDPEMRARIAEHRARRDARWITHEEPLALGAVLRATSRADRPVLVDCLTLWLSNLILDGRDVAVAMRHLLDALDAAPGPIVLVANEVGLGIVPDNALARRFRDEAGRLNQAVAARAQRVVFMAAGLPMVLKDQVFARS